MFWSRPRSTAQTPVLPASQNVWIAPTSLAPPQLVPLEYQDPLIQKIERRRRREAKRRLREEQEQKQLEDAANLEAFKAVNEIKKRSTPFKYRRWYLSVWLALLLVDIVISAGMLISWNGSQLSSVVPIPVDSTGATLCLVAQVLLLLTSGWLVYKCHTFFKKSHRIATDAKNEAEEKRQSDIRHTYMMFPMLSRWYIFIWFGATVAGGVVQGLIASSNKTSLDSSIVLASPIVLIVNWFTCIIFGLTQFVQKRRQKKRKRSEEEEMPDDVSPEVSSQVYGGKINKVEESKTRRLEGNDLNVELSYNMKSMAGPDLASDSDYSEPAADIRQTEPTVKAKPRRRKTKREVKRSSRRRRYESEDSSSFTESDDSFATTIVPATRTGRRVQPHVYAKGLERPPQAITRYRR